MAFGAINQSIHKTSLFQTARPIEKKIKELSTQIRKTTHTNKHAEIELTYKKNYLSASATQNLSTVRTNVLQDLERRLENLHTALCRTVYGNCV